MLICRNAEGVHGKIKVGNPWRRQKHVEVAYSSFAKEFCCIVQNLKELGL